MRDMLCPGLPASWVNAWLAAVGATRLEPRLRLRWTLDSLPRAVLCADDADPAGLLAAAWPTHKKLRETPIAETWGDTPPVKRKVSVMGFAARARAARSKPSSWTLSSTMTDLDVDANGEVAHAPFDPPVPRGFTLHDRLIRVSSNLVEPSVERLVESLQGTAARVNNNGLGFDVTRLASQADKTDPWVDPVIEILAFLGLAFLPVRGTGTDNRTNKSARSSARQRGWHRDHARTELRFHWPAWRPPLDFTAIDALLDIWNWKDQRRWASVGVHGGWRTVRFQRRGSSDVTRGFGSERL